MKLQLVFVTLLALVMAVPTVDAETEALIEAIDRECASVFVDLWRASEFEERWREAERRGRARLSVEVEPPV